MNKESNQNIISTSEWFPLLLGASEPFSLNDGVAADF